MNKTKGQLEAEISEAITRFEKEHLGRGPRETKSFIIADLVLIRLKGILTPAEEKLAIEKGGATLIKEMRMRLIDSSQPMLRDMIESITHSTVNSFLTDIDPGTGERVFVFSLTENLENKLLKKF